MSKTQYDYLDGVGSFIIENPSYMGGASLLYLEIQPGVIMGSIFEDAGSYLQYHLPHKPISPLVMSERSRLKRSSRWGAMSYFLSGENFDVEFIYPDQLPGDLDEDRRSEKAARKWLGDKPIRYPPLAGQPFDLQFPTRL